MKVFLPQTQLATNQHLFISGSKSESNRLLILKQLFDKLQIGNLSDADDVRAMEQALESKGELVDIHHAGTTMRFLTAYYSLCTTREVVLTGSSRMQERPIGVLVEALRQLNAEITYVNKEGFPPLKIKGHLSEGGKITLPANVSSQYITALLLIGTKLEKGMELHLIGEVTSRPYIEMTLQLLRKLGAKVFFEDNVIHVYPIEQIVETNFVVESDWSSASYFYSMIALSEIGTKIQLSSYKEESLQGDSKVALLYEQLGVNTSYQADATIELTKVKHVNTAFEANLIETPDLAQTIAVTCFGLGIDCRMSGLHTLKIKETDRLLALKTELSKLGATISVDDENLTLEASKEIRPNISIDTYQDHRMALAFAPLALKTNLMINEAEVVTKSFISYWDDLQKLGFQVQEQ
ncbi:MULTISPECIES: 3-phosphoshikimate 1-carboxyvinyltransferase [Myroides]|uniref:3-phosphoshikimate 1-carboxyvinyltransferase n=1 Tax=Myroides TaxID=76831 RepID=UPI00132201D8|nr:MULTISPECIES: 3-phosphoshikimate 1-carboxyvinyltransferase [Myroides]MVX36009.1 3-phosphoshikimate 1-carboxyvinyltransferase [Myroides sp. LoEW2-1]UVD78527.1 3-phosphoshikimate 1-carboxyvinyltransferase [Myroides albus]